MASHWDVFHLRRSNSLHDYDQTDFLINAEATWRSLRFGAEVGRRLLDLEQENVYTDADRLDGERDIVTAKAHVLYSRPQGHRLLRLRRYDVTASAGWTEGFAGDVEALGEWPLVCLRLRAQTSGNRIELTQDIGGFRFPFVFPFRTDRLSGRLRLERPDGARLCAWGGVETSHGSGEEVQGFENRLWNRRYFGGASFAYGLRPVLYRDLVARLEAGRGWLGFRFTVNRHVGKGDLGMHFNGTRYLRVQNLETCNTNLRLDVVPYGPVSLFGGWERLQVVHNGDTFADVWPFVVWDVFDAKRFRLGEMDIHLDTWFVGAGGFFERGWFDVEASGRYEWWEDAGEFDWLERIAVLFPFVFRYDRHTVTTNVRQTHAIQLDLSVSVRVTTRSSIRFSGRAMVPFGRDEKEPSDGTPGEPGGVPAPDDDAERARGGLIGTVELISNIF